MRIYYANIPLDNLTLDHALSRVQLFFQGEGHHYIVTPNPEIILLAARDHTFTEALQKADLALIDGVGLAMALRCLGQGRVSRLSGSDFLLALLERIGERQSVFFLGGEHGVSTTAAAMAHQKYGTAVVGTLEPARGTYDSTDKLQIIDAAAHLNILNTIRQTSPRLLVVALGHGLQEKWMSTFLDECPSVRVAIGVGGALDYLSGRVRRAPNILCRYGLEWVWRLSLEPWRVKRIFRATIMFTGHTIKYYFSQRFRYRPNVVGCIFNSDGKILIVARADEPNHWQFPQGGRDPGETAENAILREMREELGTDKIEIVGRSRDNFYRYDWQRQHTATRINTRQRHYGYRGQRLTAFYLRFTGRPEDIRLDQREHVAYQWVAPDDLLSVIQPVRRPMATIILRQLHDYVK